METIITRVGFCLDCHKSKRPHINQTFLVYGSKGYHIRHALRIGLYGFTPHIYKLIKSLGENIIIEKCCGMYECGVDRKLDPSGYYFYFPDKWKRQVFTIPQWNGLVKWKHDWDYWV